MQSQLVGVHHIEATKSAFAAITVQAGVEASKNGEAAVKVTLKSRVVTWGDQLHGGDSSDVQHRLDDIVQLKATKHLHMIHQMFFQKPFVGLTGSVLIPFSPSRYIDRLDAIPGFSPVSTEACLCWPAIRWRGSCMGK